MLSFCSPLQLNFTANSIRQIKCNGFSNTRRNITTKANQSCRIIKSSLQKQAKPPVKHGRNLLQHDNISISKIINKGVAIAAAAFLFTSFSINPAIADNNIDDTQQHSEKTHTPLNGSPQRWSNTEQGRQQQEQRHLDEYDPSIILLRAHWDVHSIDSNTETLLVFANESSQVVDVWWVDYTGKEVFYGSLMPGTTHVQPSFASHPWVVRDHLSQNSVLVLVATSSPAMAVVKNI